MCGRYTREYTWRQVHDFLNLKFPSAPEMPPSYNVAPSQLEPVCRVNQSGERELVPMLWGFKPAWAEQSGPASINSRIETAQTSPMFRKAFAQRRCLIPASAFYEWKRTGKTSQPFYIHPGDGTLFCFAGLWEPPAESGQPDTFTILTTEANNLVRPIHARMPVILDRNDHAAWLAGELPAERLAAPYPANRMAAHPVAQRVGNPNVNDPTLMRPTEPEPPPPKGLFE